MAIPTAYGFPQNWTMIRDAVAASTAFQAWCREADAGFPLIGDPTSSKAAALDKVYIGQLLNAGYATRPWCFVTPLPNSEDDAFSTGDTDDWNIRGEVLIEFARDIPSEYKDEPDAAIIDFAGATDGATPRGVAKIIEEMQAYQADGMPYLTRFKMIWPPSFPMEEEDPEDLERYLITAYEVSYGLDP